MRRLEYRTRLLIFFALWWLAWAYRPWHFSDWLLENLLTVAFVALLVATRNLFRLSNVSYTVLLIFLCLHTIGSHYTYADVPYERWTAVLGFSVNDLFGFDRNHFDRLVHFLYGLLLAYPVREFYLRVVLVRGLWGYLLPLGFIMATSMAYELLEWAAALVFGGDVAHDYVGAQGDPWDAQKDMALATLGATTSMTITLIANVLLDRDFAAEWADSLRVKFDQPLGEEAIARMLEKLDDVDRDG